MRGDRDEAKLGMDRADRGRRYDRVAMDLPDDRGLLSRRTLLQAAPIAVVPFLAVPGLAGASAAVVQTSGGRAATFIDGPRDLDPGESLADFSRLGASDLEMSASEIFIRTPAPAAISDLAASEAAGWQVLFDAGEDASGHFRDFGGPEREISVGVLRARSQDQGVHVCECAENEGSIGFRRLSAARWSGVPLQELFVENMSNLNSSLLVRIQGIEASWIMTVGEARSSGAFLATGIDDGPLTADLGAPVRLVVPGWYGCSWIKWVTAVEIVPGWEPASAWMQRFTRARFFRAPWTDGQPLAAREFTPPIVEFGAVPVRVGATEAGDFQLTGVSWGDPEGVSADPNGHGAIEIRIVDSQGRGGWQAVRDFVPPPTSSWSLWSHRFDAGAGDFTVELRRANPEAPSGRLERGDFTRGLRITAA